MKNLTLLVVLMLARGLLWAHEYAVPVDTAAWYVEPTRLSCRLRQEVPNYGQAIFETQSGQKQHFSLKALREVSQADVVTLASITPQWRYPNQVRRIGRVQGLAGAEPVRLDDDLASVLLDHLQEGFAPVITHSGWQAMHSVRVQVSPVNFQAAYGAYLDCLTQLFPVGFDTVVRTSVLFDVNSADVARQYMDRLELVANYVQADPAVRAIVIDGHTDNTGRKGSNWDLSRRRAEAVRDTLVRLGIASDQVVLRYHGESLPIASNSTASERSRNRRVTLRLEREKL